MTYYGANRKTYILDDIPIKKGGEGAIHTVSGKSNLLAKIYLAPAKSPELKEKISLMVKNPPRQDILDQIAWPIDILSDAGGNFVGFVMPKLSIDVELGDVYKYPAKKKVTLTGEQKVIIAINICRVISAIHDLDYVFGDFNPCNIGVNLTNGHVAFLDTDSYHITDKAKGKTYRCNVCLNGYVAPELIKKCKNTGYAQAPLPTFTKETDLFSLAIHIFKLLMNGFTPYNGIPENERSSTASPGVGNAAIEMDHYCFKAGNRPLSVAVLPLQAFPSDVQRLFTRAFDEGHQNPSKRPTAKEWDAVLTNYHSNLKQCSANPMHHHYKGLQTCPYCEADQRYNFTMSMSSVYGTSSGSPSSSQMSFSTPMTPPPTPPSGSSYKSSSYNSSGSGQYSGTVLSSSGSSTRVSQRNSNGFSKKFLMAIIIAVLAIAIIAGGILGIVSAVQNSKINAVETLISDLPTDPEYYLDYHQEIVEAYAAYQELDPKLQAKVENADKLFTCMESLEVEEAYEMQQNLQFTEANGGYAVSVKSDRASNLSGNVEIPATYRGQPVTTIPENAFAGCSRITSITVPDSVTNIGYAAFSGCSSIQKITLPFVGGNATDTNKTGRFGYIFGTGQYAGGTAVNFGKYDGWSTDPYYIPSQLKTVIITNATQLAPNAFYNCTQLTEIELNEDIMTVGSYAFYGCKGITNISMPNILTISNGMLEGCSSLKSFTINSNINTISDYAFKNCSALSSINSTVAGEYIIPSTITNIGYEAFSGCILVQKITLPFVGGNSTATNKTGRFGYIFGSSQYTGGTSVNFGKYDGWSTDPYYIPSRLKTVIITNATQLAPNAFYNCAQLTEIDLNEDIMTVGSYAFYGCKGITNISMPNILTISNGMLEGCSSLKSFTINSNINTISDYAFKNCSALSSINSTVAGEYIIPSTITNIGYEAFSGCILVQKITLPFVGGNSTATNKTGRFGYIFGSSQYTGGTSVNFGKYDGWSTDPYYIPSQLKTVIITNATQLAPNAFYNCTQITYLQINRGAQYNVGANAFNNCIEPVYN